MERSRQFPAAAVVGIILLGICSPGLGKIIYVDEDAPPGGDGVSWQTAYQYLQDALADARTAEKPVEIRVAQGIYQPDRGAQQTPGDRIASFELIDDMALRGGFAGMYAPDPNARNAELYETILSGDLAGNDVDVNDPCDLLNEPTRAENSYHVLTALYTCETAVVDGFTITSGNDSQYRRSRGGALWCWFATPTVKNCVIHRNSAIDYGGGISEAGRVEDCLVTENYARGQGGGLFRCGPVCRCVVMHNVAGTHGGGISYCESITDCVVSENSAGMIGGGVAGTDFFTSQMVGCTVTGNHATVGGGIAFCNTVRNCLVAGNRADLGAGLYNCSLLANSTIASNRANKLGGGIYQGSRKTTVSNTILWANTATRGTQVALSGSCAGASGVPGPGHPAVSICYYGSVSFRYSTVAGGTVGIYADREGCEVEWMEGNLETDPCFANPGYWDPNGTLDDPNDDFFVEGDYHLKSQAGRWDPATESWVVDDVTSPCIDAGDPNGPIGQEAFPNGGRVNTGAYGGTAEAGKSYFGEPPCETIIAGDINGDCKVDLADLLILMSHWLQEGQRAGE